MLHLSRAAQLISLCRCVQRVLTQQGNENGAHRCSGANNIRQRDVSFCTSLGQVWHTPKPIPLLAGHTFCQGSHEDTGSDKPNFLDSLMVARIISKYPHRLAMEQTQNKTNVQQLRLTLYSGCSLSCLSRVRAVLS